MESNMYEIGWNLVFFGLGLFWGYQIACAGRNTKPDPPEITDLKEQLADRDNRIKFLELAVAAWQDAANKNLQTLREMRDRLMGKAA